MPPDAESLERQILALASAAAFALAALSLAACDVDPDAAQPRVLEHQAEEAVLALSLHEVLVQDHTGQQPQPRPHADLPAVDQRQITLSRDHER